MIILVFDGDVSSKVVPAYINTGVDWTPAVSRITPAAGTDAMDGFITTCKSIYNACGPHNVLQTDVIVASRGNRNKAHILASRVKMRDAKKERARFTLQQKWEVCKTCVHLFFFGWYLCTFFFGIFLLF